MNRALRACTYTAGAALALTLGACISPQVGAPCPIPDNATPEQRRAALQNCYGGIGEGYFPASQLKDVDILFMIDNSSSMSPKQAALAQNIPLFIQEIENFDANYHLAVVTSDIGSTIADGQFWNDPTIQVCNSFKGDDGLMQIQSCKRRTNVSTDALNACNTLCTNPAFANAATVTNDGARYISKIDGKTNIAGNLVAEAFKCMALVGDGGCGIEGQLESTKRALDGHLTENLGFRRSNAVLAVIFITDEDDCSVQVSRRSENSPSTRDCANPDQNASFDCFNYDYRCLARSIQCDQPMNTPGAKTNCHERADNYLEPLKKYYDFFSAQVEPNRLVISGVWTRPSLDESAMLNINYAGAGNSSPFLNRAGGVQASCAQTGMPSVYGQAQRRLSAFADMFKTDGTQASICQPENYPSNLKEIAGKIKNKLGPMCLPVVPKLLAPNQPNCLVGDVDESNKNALPDVLLPACSATCCAGWANSPNPVASEPDVAAACMAETKDCFCAARSTQPNVCTGSDGVGAVGGVWRVGNASTPSGRFVNFRCAGGG